MDPQECRRLPLSAAVLVVVLAFVLFARAHRSADDSSQVCALPASGSVQLNVVYEHCTLVAAVVSYGWTKHDNLGNPTHTYIVSLDVLNHTRTLKGPRIMVRFLDATQTVKGDWSIVADSLEGDLPPGQRKTFTGLVKAAFIPAYVETHDLTASPYP